MSDQEFLAAISTDELGWLNAYNTILQDPPSPSAPIPIPIPPSSSVSAVPINDSLTLLRAKGMGRRRYQTSTKSSHAKSVQSKAAADIGLPASLRTSVTPRRTRTNSFRNGARANRASPTKLAQQEWIYRHPKSPGTPGSAPTTVGASPRHSNISSPIRPARRPATRYGPPEEQSPPFWSNVLRPHSRPAKGVPLSQLKVEQSTSYSSSKLPSPASHYSSPISAASSSSSTLSSRPDTPTSSSLPSLLRYNGQKYQRRYGDLAFDSDSSASTLIGRVPSSSRSILAEPLPRRELPEQASALSATRKNSVGTTASSTGSSKSVKFVELPTVHYASVGYWDAEHLKDDDEVMMGIDVDGMDMEIRDSPIPSRKRQDTDGSGDIDIFAIDGPPWMHPDADNFESPRRETSIQTTEKPGPMKRLASLRKGSTARSGRSSIPVPVKSRPSISGPLVLGSRPMASAQLTRSSTSAISIRHAPSVESFRSGKSGGAKSIRSLSSLKSLPISLKSTVTANARGLREWFRERVVGLDIGVVG